jgi:trimeric autotransporter adhesin
MAGKRITWLAHRAISLLQYRCYTYLISLMLITALFLLCNDHYAHSHNSLLQQNPPLHVEDARRRILALYKALPPLNSTAPVRLPERVLTLSPVNDSAELAAAAGSSSGGGGGSSSLKRPSPSTSGQGGTPQKQARLAFPPLPTATVPGTVSNSSMQSSSGSSGGVLHRGAAASPAAAAASTAAADVPWSLKRPAAQIPGALSPHNKRGRPASSGTTAGTTAAPFGAATGTALGGQKLSGTSLDELRAEAQARATAAAFAGVQTGSSSSNSSCAGRSAPAQGSSGVLQIMDLTGDDDDDVFETTVSTASGTTNANHSSSSAKGAAVAAAADDHSAAETETAAAAAAAAPQQLPGLAAAAAASAASSGAAKAANKPAKTAAKPFKTVDIASFFKKA